MSDKPVENEPNDPVKKLESEFHSFQVEWNKFLTNDFHHLVANVDTLVKQSDAIQQNMTSMEKKMTSMEKNIIEALGARAYNWVPKK